MPAAFDCYRPATFQVDEQGIAAAFSRSFVIRRRVVCWEGVGACVGRWGTVVVDQGPCAWRAGVYCLGGEIWEVVCE